MTTDYLFSQIVDEHPYITGWCSINKAIALASTVVALRPELVYEIGVFGGASAIPIALALKYCNAGKLIAIDPWEKSASVENMEPVNAAWWGAVDHNDVLRKFEAHLQRLSLVPFVTIARTRSDDITPEEISLLHVDGNHGPQALKDAQRFGACVRVGGIAFLDDIGWSGGNVSKAVDHLLSIGFVKLYTAIDNNCEWGVFQRVAMTAPVARNKKR